MPGEIKKILSNSWFRLVCGFLLLELLSFAAFPSLWLSRAAFVFLIILAAALSIRKIEYGAYLLLAELVVGGLGYLVAYPLGEGRITLRLGLFAAVFLVWLAKFLIRRDFSALRDWRLVPLGVFLALAAVAVAKGMMSGYPPGAVFADVNGYLYFGLIGLFLSVKLSPARLMQILLAGSFVVGLKTVLTLFLFAHGYAFVGPMLFYQWIRDTGTGEISLISAPLFRVFFQSHFYSLLALLLSAYILLRPGEKTGSHAALDSLGRSAAARSALWLIAWFNFFIIVVSQSRSFWVAGLASLVVFIPAAALYFGVAWRRVLACVLLIPVFALIANLAGQTVIGDFRTNFLSGRISGSTASAAVSSRMAELGPAFELISQKPLLGHGFGRTVRFRSDDPRIKNAANPEGWTDAASLEWGYLDLAVKAGLLGLLVYSAFLACLAWELVRSIRQGSLLASGLLIGLLALLAVHMFTPYLNHPLGIGYLLALMSLTKKSA